MEKLEILYGVQGNGISFGLRNRDIKILKELFPDSQPPKGIFVEYDMKNNFEKYHAQLERYIFPALLGLANETDLKTIKKVVFIKTPEYITTYTIEQNDEQKIQPVSRQVGAVSSYV
jgi:hypothetical protein